MPNFWCCQRGLGKSDLLLPCCDQRRTSAVMQYLTLLPNGAPAQVVVTFTADVDAAAADAADLLLMLLLTFC